MNHQERGLYILLLCLQWTQGKITGDDIAHLSADMPQHSVFKVRGKFLESEDGGLRNERLEQERAKQVAFRAKKEIAGKAGAEKRWHNHGTPIVLPLANGMANDSSPSPSPSSKEEEEFVFGSCLVPRLVEGWFASCLSLLFLDLRRDSPDFLPAAALFSRHSCLSFHKSSSFSFVRNDGMCGCVTKQTRTICEPPLNQPSFMPDNFASTASSSGIDAD